MSTNINIDVTLQRLQEVANETTEKNREEKKAREEDLAIEEKAAELSGERDGSVPPIEDLLDSLGEPLSRTGERPSEKQKPNEADKSSVPDLYKKLDPGAGTAPRLSITNGWFAQDYSLKRESIAVGEIAGTVSGTSETLNLTTGEFQRFYVGSGSGNKWLSFDVTYDVTTGPDDWEGGAPYFSGGSEFVGGSRTVYGNLNRRKRIDTIALPAGGDKFVLLIVVSIASYQIIRTGFYFNFANDIKDKKTQGGDISSAYANSIQRQEVLAFLCGRSDIKSIPASQALLNGIPKILPARTESVLILSRPVFGNPITVTVPAVPRLLLQDQSAGYYGSSIGGTPGVYFGLNQLINYTSQDSVLDPAVPSGRIQGVLENEEEGGFSLQGRLLDVYSSGDPVEYIYNRYKGPISELSSFFTIDPEKVRNLPARNRLNLESQREPLPGSLAAENLFVDELLDLDLISVSDWGLPGYCRSQLRALGFSSEDLTF